MLLDWNKLNNAQEIHKKILAITLVLALELLVFVLSASITTILLTAQYSTDQDQNSEPSQIFESEVNDKLYDNSITR